VSETARKQLAERAPVGTPVQQVIVGALRTIDTDFDDDNDVYLTVEFEANVMTAQHTYYSVERWWFKRAKATHSKPPGVSRTFRCPNCGAPWQASASGTQVCASCNQVVDNGRFDWVVDELEVASIDERPPSLTKEVEERGTDLPTYKAGDRDAQWDALIAAEDTYFALPEIDRGAESMTLVADRM